MRNCKKNYLDSWKSKKENGHMTKIGINDLKDMVYTKNLAYNETVVIIDINYLAATTTSNTLPPGKVRTGDINKTSVYSIPFDKKVLSNCYSRGP